jgi:hypothetical protein
LFVQSGVHSPSFPAMNSSLVAPGWPSVH